MTTSTLQSEALPFPGAKIPSAPATRIRRNTKLGRILTVLAAGRSLNRFEAERIGDHCLHSTVAKIERYGIRVQRHGETVPGYGGHRVRVMRYSLSDDDRRLATISLGWRED